MDNSSEKKIKKCILTSKLTNATFISIRTFMNIQNTFTLCPIGRSSDPTFDRSNVCHAKARPKNNISRFKSNIYL